MKAWLFATTIKRKLTLIIMLTCSVALILACAAILFFEIAGTKQILKHNTQVMAEVIGANSSAALSFKDKSAAKETLAALRAEPYVISACLYRQDGEVFATYYREGTKQVPPPTVRPESLNFEDATLNLFHKIILDGEVIGTVLIQSDLRLIRERLQTYLGIIGFVMLSATFVAFLLSLRLQQLSCPSLFHRVANPWPWPRTPGSRGRSCPGTRHTADMRRRHVPTRPRARHRRPGAPVHRRVRLRPGW